MPALLSQWPPVIGISRIIRKSHWLFAIHCLISPRKPSPVVPFVQLSSGSLRYILRRTPNDQQSAPLTRDFPCTGVQRFTQQAYVVR